MTTNKDDRLYRTEGFSGSGERDAARVLAYEIYELGNTDILHYLLEETETISSPGIKAEMEDITRELEEEGYICDWNIFDAEDFSDRILDEIALTTSYSITAAIWLASHDVVMNRYGGTPDSIDEYPAGDVILSDLGYDGILYGYSYEPAPL